MAIQINNKLVNSISIGGKDIPNLTIDGNKYTFPSDIIITEDEVKTYIKDHTIWGIENPPVAEKIITTNEYTNVTRSTPYANCIHLTDYTWPATVETKDGVLFTFSSDVNSFYTSSDHFWISKGDTFGADAIKVMSAPWPTQSFNAGETWFFSTKGVPVKIESTAKVDLTNTIQKLKVELSKSNGIKDEEKIDATVKLDTNIASTINGVAADFIVSDIDIINPDRLVSEQQTIDYVESNIDTNGNVNLLNWPYTGTKLHTDNIQINSGVEHTFTVQADHGYTINGGQSFEVKLTYTIPPTEITGIQYSSLTTSSGNLILNGYYGPITSLNPNGQGSNLPRNGLLLFIKDTNRNINLSHNSRIYTGKSSLNNFNFNLGLTSHINLSVSSGETWLFKNGQNPVKVS